ncbi:MAG: serine hydrolase domain-containing protein [Gemmatimonadaceae bacterium]|nr:serine hydrolase domain-containing protein [Gemmatimonadaceae bacterium]
MTVAAVATAAWSGGSRAQSAALPPAPLTAFVDSLARAGFSGTVLVADTTRVRLLRAMGVADQRTGRLITRRSRWRWASVSKQVTAALVMREVDRGRIALDSPAVRYFPAFRGDGREAITVRQLLQHTSGLLNPDRGPTDADGVPSVYRRRGVVGDAAAARQCVGPLAAAPGTTFDYNNCDFLVLGALLRAVTGRSTADLAREFFGRSVAGPEAVRGYPGATGGSTPFNLATYGSAGAMTGTVEDLLAFDRALLGPTLSTEARATMWQGEPRFGYAALGAWSFDATLRGCHAPLPIVERRGDIYGVQVRNVLLPTRGLVVIAFTNRGDVAFGEVWQQAGLLFNLLSLAACGGTD